MRTLGSNTMQHPSLSYESMPSPPRLLKPRAPVDEAQRWPHCEVTQTLWVSAPEQFIRL